MFFKYVVGPKYVKFWESMIWWATSKIHFKWCSHLLLIRKTKFYYLFQVKTWNIIWLNFAKWFKEWNILITWLFLLKMGFQLNSNMINIKKYVLLIQELIQVPLLAFHVMFQVLIINTNNHCTESKLQTKLNGSDKLEVVVLPFFLSLFYYRWYVY